MSNIEQEHLWIEVGGLALEFAHAHTRSIGDKKKNLVCVCTAKRIVSSLNR